MPGVEGVSEEQIMNMKELLVALLLLLPLKKELLIRTPDPNVDFEKVHKYLSPTKKKVKGKLEKAVPQTQIDGLLYCLGVISFEDSGNEIFKEKNFREIINTTTKCEIQFHIKRERRGPSSQKVHILKVTNHGNHAASNDIYGKARSMLEKAARLYANRISSTERSSERRSKRRRLVSPTPTNATPPPINNAAPTAPTAPTIANVDPATPLGGELLYDNTDDDVTADDDDEIEIKLRAAENLDFSVQERCLPNGMPVTKCNLSYDSINPTNHFWKA